MGTMAVGPLNCKVTRVNGLLEDPKQQIGAKR